MISKFSVKKPYTVLVGVVLVLVLGYVSFTSMQTDLLPDMNLPYAIVYTTYIGASPEEVESTVTKTEWNRRWQPSVILKISVLHPQRICLWWS